MKRRDFVKRIILGTGVGIFATTLIKPPAKEFKKVAIYLRGEKIAECVPYQFPPNDLEKMSDGWPTIPSDINQL